MRRGRSGEGGDCMPGLERQAERKKVNESADQICSVFCMYAWSDIL